MCAIVLPTILCPMPMVGVQNLAHEHGKQKIFLLKKCLETLKIDTQKNIFDFILCLQK